MCKCFVSGATLAIIASAASGSIYIELRVVERTGQTVASPSDPVLNFAVQARALQGQSIAQCGFDLHMQGESEAWGSLTRDRISNTDGTYFPGIQVSNAVGLGGLARQYTYVAQINGAFNGLLNASAATFTNGPDQEIGLVHGATLGPPLLGIPGMDADQDGNPDGWIGNGTGQTPANGATAPVPASLAGPYLGRGEFIDMYRFRYTVTDFHARTVNLSFEEITCAVFGNMTYSNGLWGGSGYVPTASEMTGETFQFSVIPSPSAIGVLLCGGFRAVRRRR